MLDVKNLQVKINDKDVLKGINLNIGSNEIHVIMGPNGSGKSTFASALVGRPDYELSAGEIIFLNKEITNIPPEERASMGMFLSFQYPAAIPGVSILNFLKTALNQIRKYNNLTQLNAAEFMELVKQKAALVGMNEKLLQRSLNENFSGGERKKNEIFQMAILEPKLAILDETDSGLDIDALRTIGSALNQLRNEQRSMLIITHYPRILQYIEPDFIHILYDGQIIKSGDSSLAVKLEKEGYDWILNKELKN
jgi:Fe-S cluster assembly ATP-binding protein